MGYSASLSIDLRRRIYGLALRIYETFEALPERGILVQDIESSTNKIVKLAAAYPVADIKDKIVRDIIAELRGLRALVGIVRDTSLLERKPAVDLIQETLSLEDLFRELLEEIRTDPPLEVDSSGLPKEIQSLRVMFPRDVNLVGKDASRPADVNMILHLEQQRETGVSQNINDAEGQQLRPPSQMIPSARQEAILEVLKRRSKISVGELDILFSQRVSKKTLQRDLQDLIDKGVVKREGDKRWAVYSVRLEPRP